jgi:hypothetical protein
VIVHAGFHKTGTTSLQKHLAQVRRAMAPYFAYYGQNDFKNAGARARIYAQRPFFHRRLRFRLSFRRFLNAIPDADTIVLSRETFSGVMPGHRDWRGRTLQDYAPTTIRLCREVAGELRRRFGPNTQIEFVFTVRERESWIRSVYGHLLRSIHLRESFDEFRALFPDLIDLREEAAKVAQALAPCPVHVFALENYTAHRHGTAAIIMELAGVPDAVQAKLPGAARANAGQSRDLEAQFFALNHSGKSRAELRRIKDAMLADDANS